MWNRVDQILREAARRLADLAVDFLPGLVVFTVIVLVFAVLAAVARTVVLRLLRGLEFDRRAPQLGLGFLAEWSASGRASVALARLVFWILFVVGLLAGLTALDARMPTQFALSVFHYLPNLIAACVILVAGNVLARFLARSVLISAVNMQIQSARLLSIGVKWLVLVLAGAMALEHLGIGRQILLLAFGILFGGIVLALALAVGLGSKEMVSRSLERQMREPAEETDRLDHI
jgi:hypothetical protein